VVDRKVTTSQSKKYQNFAWNEDGGLRPDYTYPYSVMHGELDKLKKQQQHEKAMSQPVIKEEPEFDAELEKRAREAGL
jgi:hypothetical protein